MALTVNIQPGDRITLVCRTAKKGKHNVVSDHFSFPTPTGSVSDGTIADIEEYSKALTAQLTNHGLKNVSDVNFCISSSKIATREITLPKVKEKQIQSMINANADDYFPVDMKQYKLTYSILGNEAEESKQKSGEKDKDAAGEKKQAAPQNKKPAGYRILLKAAPKELLNSYVGLAQKMLVHIRIMDSSDNALLQTFASAPIQGSVCYAYIAPERIECTFLSNGSYVMQRSFTYGGDELIYPVLQQEGRGEAAYYEMFSRLTKPGVQSISKDVSEQLLERVVSSITRACDYVHTTKNKPVDGVVLCGPCAHLPFLREAIQDSSGIDTAFIENIQEVAPLVNGNSDISSFVSVAGCVIKPVDLIPEAYLLARGQKGAGGKDDSYATPIAVAVVFAAIGIVLGLFAVLQYNSSQRELEAMKTEMASLQPEKEAYDRYVIYTKNSDGIDVIKNDAGGNSAQLRKFFEEIESSMPSDLLFLSASCSQTNVVLSCQTADDLDSVANVIHTFRSFQSIKVTDVSTPSVSEQKSQAGSKMLSFEVTCTFANDGSMAGNEAAGIDTTAQTQGASDSTSSSSGSSSSSSSSSGSSSSSSSTSSSQQ